MRTTTIKPVKKKVHYLADQLSQFDNDIAINAKYIKDSIDYNDNKLTSWFGASSVEMEQVESILRSYVQLVINGVVEEYYPNQYPAEYIEKVGAAATQESTLTLRCLKIMYWGVKQNRIPTNAILYPKNKQSDPNYRIPSEPGFVESMYNNVTQTASGIFNKVGSLASSTVDAAGKIIDGTGETFEGVGVLGKYGVPLIVGGAGLAVVYFAFNIAKTSDAGKVVRVVDKIPSSKGLSDMDSNFRKQVNGYKITWSKKEKRYIIKNTKNKRVYDAEYLNDAKTWIKRNTK